MKKVAVATLIVAAVAAVGLYLWANHEFTECYAMYPSRAAAERSEDAWSDAGFDVMIERRSGWGAIVTDGSTDDEPHERFLRVLKATNGKSGHGGPRDGCLVRGPIQ